MYPWKRILKNPGPWKNIFENPRLQLDLWKNMFQNSTTSKGDLDLIFIQIHALLLKIHAFECISKKSKSSMESSKIFLKTTRLEMDPWKSILKKIFLKFHDFYKRVYDEIFLWIYVLFLKIHAFNWVSQIPRLLWSPWIFFLNTCLQLDLWKSSPQSQALHLISWKPIPFIESLKKY